MKQATIDERLKAVAHLRKGNIKVHIPFRVSQPIPMKDCRICTKPAPMTACQRFACRDCQLIFD